MSQHSRSLSRIVIHTLYASVALWLLIAPVPHAFAESARSQAHSEEASCEPVNAAPSGINQPTGDDATTYLYNKCTGLWENQYYTWNPKTQVATPKTPLVYTCDTSKWKWLTHEWMYDPGAKKFSQVAVYEATLPSGAAVAADSTIPCTPPAPKEAETSAADPPAQAASSDPQTTNTNTTNTKLDNATDPTMQNTVGSTATSGVVKVTGNLQAGNATSGDAAVIANVLNSVQSTTPIANGSVATFVANVDGNVQGDLVIDPSQLQPATNSDSLNNKNLTVNDKNVGAIHNDINLAAASGDTTVRGNTQAGNATSGSATAIADVVNMLNSIVSAGKSFVGVVNIHGDMNGNILMPQSFLDSLVASNAPSTTVKLDANQANNLGITNTSNLSTMNNVTSNATTGVATVADNTTAGSAKTGNATTDVRIFNLTGSQIIGTNCLLVFVNVSGKWVGVIMNAPAGATAAALASGLTENKTNATITNETDNAITNDINVNAHSGDATVADNTEGGNATSGDAHTAVNLLNMNDAQFSLAGWFGILFINIFGNWYGNFSVFTPQPTTVTHNASQPSTPLPARPQMFRFEPSAPEDSTTGTDTTVPLGTLTAQLASKTGSVLGASINGIDKAASRTAAPNRSTQIIGGVLVAVGVVALVIERVASIRGSRRIRMSGWRW